MSGGGTRVTKTRQKPPGCLEVRPKNEGNPMPFMAVAAETCWGTGAPWQTRQRLCCAPEGRGTKGLFPQEGVAAQLPPRTGWRHFGYLLQKGMRDERVIKR